MIEPIQPISLSFCDELRQFCDEMGLSMKGHKTIRVITKCIQRGHYNLADKIGLKYRRVLPKDDMMVAMEMSLGYSKEREWNPKQKVIKQKHERN